MMLAPGTRLGAYEIIGLISEGGMGQVYRGRDTRLGRDVAIKTLPANLATDAERLRRFEAEARAAGALNHPNVLTLFDIGTEAGTSYLVSELLDGATLRHLIASAQLTRRKTLDYAAQIARGLSAAHERGIIHRDLKPDNIFVTRDERVKILDFGIAKLTRPDDDVTRTVDLAGRTDSGVMVGTLGYMSPEQVQARPVSPQSDIFSFGAVLYEMLSGRRAFEGASPLDVFNAIVRDDPPPLDSDRVRPAVERIVSRCLEKNPAQRFQSAQDLAFALEAVNEGSTREVMPAVRTKSPSRRRVLLVLGGVVALAAAASAGVWVGRQSVSGALPTFRQVTFRRGTVFSARFGPDGRSIFYSAAWDGDRAMRVFSAPAEGPESIDLQVPNAEVLATSAAGEMLVLLNNSLSGFQNIGTLATVPLAGGVPRPMMEDVFAADFAPNGRDIAVLRLVGSKVRLEFPIGTTRYEAPSTTAGTRGHVRVSPDGNQIAFDGFKDGIGVVRLDGGAPTMMARGWALDELVWAPDGREVWFSGVTATGGTRDQLRAVSVSSGRERLLAAQSASMALSDIARDGRALVTTQIDRRDMAGLFPGSSEERDYSWFTWTYPRDFSADGSWILFSEATQNYSTYLRKTDGSAAIRLGEGAAQALSPDHRWAAAVRPETKELVLLPTGAGDTRKLPHGTLSSLRPPVRWLPDSRGILFMGSEANSPDEGVYFQDIDRGDPRRVSPEGDWLLSWAGSLDGRSFIALTGSDADKVRAMVVPLDGAAPRPIAGLDPGDFPLRWSEDGRGLFFWRFGQVPAQVFRLDTTTGLRELWKTLAPPDRAGVRVIGLVLPTPDGKYYVYDYQRTLSEVYLVSGLR